MGKFNANSLSYSQNLPPFLAKLQSQYNDDRDGQRADPILAAQRRAVKKRSASEEAEDAPLVLDDNGDVVAGVTFGKDGAAKVDTKETEETKEGGLLDGQKATVDVDAVAGIGAGKKKKVGRVIGGESDGENGEDKDGDSADRKKRKRAARDDYDTKDSKDKKLPTSGTGKDKEKTDKKKKKARKVQLSFEDDEDEG